MLLPDVGDIAWVDLDDARGTEQASRRPALVMTSRGFHEMSRRTIICPITSKRRDWPTNVHLPDGLKIAGTVLVDQIRSIDRAERMFDIVERVPHAVILAVHLKLTALLGFDLSAMLRGTEHA